MLNTQNKTSFSNSNERVLSQIQVHSSDLVEVIDLDATLDANKTTIATDGVEVSFNVKTTTETNQSDVTSAIKLDTMQEIADNKILIAVDDTEVEVDAVDVQTVFVVDAVVVTTMVLDVTTAKDSDMSQLTVVNVVETFTMQEETRKCNALDAKSLDMLRTNVVVVSIVLVSS